MRSYLFDFNVISGAEADLSTRLHRDDWHAAQGGYDNERNQHHLNAVNSENVLHNRRGKDGKADDLIDIILSQPPYDVLFAETMSKLRGAEGAVDDVLNVVAQRLAANQVKLDDLIERAAELPDGTKVARDQNGDVRALDGAIIDPEKVTPIEWKGNEPTFEQIQIERSKVDADLSIQSQARTNQVRLGEIREELDDKPPADRVQELGEEADAIMKRSEEALKLANNVEATREVPPLIATEIPTLG